MNAGEALGLAPYAAEPTRSRGRRYAEPPARGRTDFQRDRDRIIHCTAFRRLEYKTQVFVNHEGDLFRTRLTHSLEVAQIGRAIARTLRLNEDLVEAVSLAHDLGHTPFGHAGQDALAECMQPHGGFEHNLQSLRVVDELEERYGAFNGLNLTFETREGILKHCSLENARKLGELGERFLLRRQPSLEAQIANLADEIAYNNHDIDDGLRSQLISSNSWKKCRCLRGMPPRCGSSSPASRERRMIHETVRRMINTLIVDLTEESSRRIAGAAPASIDDVRKVGTADRVFGVAARRGRRAEALPARQPLPALPCDAHDDQGEANRAGPVRRVRRRASPAAGRPPGARGGGQGPRHCRLRGRHDRSLRHP